MGAVIALDILLRELATELLNKGVIDEAQFHEFNSTIVKDNLTPQGYLKYIEKHVPQVSFKMRRGNMMAWNARFSIQQEDSNRSILNSIW